MQDLNDLYYFVQVVDHGSYAEAARSLGIPKSKLSRRVIALEERLGVRLMQRSTRKLTITEIGQKYYHHCVAMLVEARSAQEAIDLTRSEPQGLIRISAPPALVCYEVGPMIARYMMANPLVTVELDSTARRVDVIGEGIDVALRVRFPPLEDSDLALRVLGDREQRIVASPGLIENISRPISPADLSVLPSLDMGPASKGHFWDLIGPGEGNVRIPHNPRLVTDDMSQLLHAAIEGVGVVQLPSMVVDDMLSAGKIVDLLPRWTAAAGQVHAIFASRRGLLPSVRSFIDFMVAEYQAEQSASKILRGQT
ncbi:LysR substrate-binding domain-containing protein [Yoonia sp. MH D7]